MPVVRGGTVSPECKDPAPLWGLGPALFLQCPVRGRASKWWGWLSMTLWFHHSWFLWTLRWLGPQTSTQTQLQQYHTPRHGPWQQLGPGWIITSLRSVWSWMEHGPWLGASVWPLVSTWVMDVNIEPGWGRTTDPDMADGSIPCQDITLVPGGNQATNNSLFLTAFASSVLSLSRAHKLFCFSSSPISPPHTYSSYWYAPTWCHKVPDRLWMSSCQARPWGPRLA